MAEWKFSQHALQRGVEMALDAEDLRNTLYHPDVTYNSARKYPGCKIHAKDRIALAVSYETMTVITVLWNTKVTDRTDTTELFRD